MNRERASDLMSDSGVDAILATTPENVFYVTDFAGWTPRVYRGIGPEPGIQAYGLFGPQDPLPALVIPAWEATYVVNHGLRGLDIRTYGRHLVAWPENAVPGTREERALAEMIPGGAGKYRHPAEALIALLEDRGLTRGRIAVEHANFAPGVLAKVQSAFPNLDFVEGYPYFAAIRMVKMPEEVSRLREAARVNEEALTAVISALHVGVSEVEMRTAFKTRLGEMDAEFEFFNSPLGTRAGSFMPPSNRRMQPGDSIWIDGGSIYRFYHADTGTCGFAGEAPQAFKDLYAGMLETLEAGLELIRPGTHASEVHEAMAHAQEKAGMTVLGGYGHGIGVEARDWPVIGPGRKPRGEGRLEAIMANPPIEQDAVLCLEVPYWEFGRGAVHIEYTLRVTSHGFEPLIPHERQFLTVPA